MRALLDGLLPRLFPDDGEVGGQRGREALDRLRNVIGRIESSFPAGEGRVGVRDRQAAAAPAVAHALSRQRVPRRDPRRP